jgi:hypothetical protein
VNRLLSPLLLAGALCLAAGALPAGPLAVGEAVPPIAARDQHGVRYVFTNGTAFLLVALDRDSATTANRRLAEAGAGFLEKHRAVYLMDIHAMPAIARFFALPKLRKYPQRIVLGETTDALNWVPAQAGRLTVLKLTPAGCVEKISYWQPANESVIGLFKPE